MAEAHILSGGVDSTSVLYRRLTETKNEVHVLHVRGSDAAALGHTRAARQIVIWLAKNVRNFIYEELFPTRMAGKACGNNVFAQCGFLVGEYAVRHPEIIEVVQGCNGSTEDQSEGSLFRNQYRENICTAVCNGYTPAPKWVYPNFALTKAQVYQLMPEELRKLCWVCMSPRVDGERIAQCGECSKCRELQASVEGRL